MNEFDSINVTENTAGDFEMYSTPVPKAKPSPAVVAFFTMLAIFTAVGLASLLIMMFF